MTTSTAPGKIILAGEHAVVYGHPAVALPVTQVQATAEVLSTSKSGIKIVAPDIKLSSELSRLSTDHPLAFAVRGVLSTLGISDPPGLTVKITSTIPVASGLGSGAAVSVAIIRALCLHLGKPLPNDEVSRLAYEVEKLYHGTPSGIDNTVVTYAKPVHFIIGQPIDILQVGAPLTIVIGDTGISSPTRLVVGDVRKMWESEPRRWEKVFRAVGDIAQHTRLVIEAGDVSALGRLMNDNHCLLQEMTVSSPELDRLVETARSAGALGAKLSGAGRGGNMIALTMPEGAQKIAKALCNSGARDTITTSIQTS